MTAEDPQSAASAIQELNTLTRGAFAATQSQERAQLLKSWLETQPSLTDLNRVYKEMSGRDKGAAKVLKEAIDSLKREHHQEELVVGWSLKAQHVLSQHPFVMGDALAWVRDAAKAGAPLSKEPLAGLKAQLSERIKSVEDLQQQCMVRREGVHLLMQRMDNLSAREWSHAQAALAAVQEDVEQGIAALDKLLQHPDWPHVDLRFPSQIEQSRQLLWAAWQAFEAAGQAAAAASQDPQAPLPGVHAWAESIQRMRHPESVPAPQAKPEAETPKTVAKPEPTPEELAQRQAVHAQRVELLAQAVALTRWVGEETAPVEKGAQEVQAQEVQAQDQPGQDQDAALNQPAEATLTQEEVVSASETQETQETQAADGVEKNEQTQQADSNKADPAQAKPQAKPQAAGHWEAAQPVRQIQQQLRTLREAWKALDHQAPIHHGLWRKFDQACNRAYPFVKAWLGELKEQNQSHLAQRETLIAQVQEWTAKLGDSPDWKQVQRDLQHFSDEWRHCGHLNEKSFTQILPQWKAAIKAAEAPLHHAVRENIAQRKQLIDEAKALSEQSPLPIESIKALQARWQQVSQTIAIDRRLGQKLWESFRQPIDEAFARNPKPARGPGRQAPASRAPLTPHEQAVMAATQELEQAIAQRDAARIQVARDALQTSLRSSQAASTAASTATPALPVTPPVETAQPASVENVGEENQATSLGDPTHSEQAAQGQEQSLEPAPVKAPIAPRKVVAVRGDDRHKIERPIADGRRDRGQGGPGGRSSGRDGRDGRDGRAGRDGRDHEARGPRLSDSVFMAQRLALEKAEKAMRTLSAQAHGEHLRQLIDCWKSRDVNQLPSAKSLGKGLDSTQWQSWKAALADAPKNHDATAWIRLDMAAGLPSPASDQAQRRAYQLQLLTQRHAATPEQTWPQEVAKVLSTAHSPSGEQRLQDALKVLLGRR